MLCTIGLDLLLTVLLPLILLSPLFTSVCVFISTVCFLVRYLFRLLLSLGKTITFSPSLCRHFSIFYQWKQKHAIMNSSLDFGFSKYLILSTSIEQKVRILFSFLFFFNYQRSLMGDFIFQEIEYVLHIIRINDNLSFLYLFLI